MNMTRWRIRTTCGSGRLSATDGISPNAMWEDSYSHYVAVYLNSEGLVHTGSIQGAALLLAFYVLTALPIETYFFLSTLSH